MPDTQDNSKNQDTELDERMAILGKLTARVAHELNNPLDGMLRYINLSISQLNKNQPEKVPGYLDQVREGLNQMSAMVASLLDFSRKDKAAEQYVDINKLLEDSIKFIEISSYNEKVNITRKFSTAAPQIKTGNLPNVFSNIIKNAVQASGVNGKIIISTEVINDRLQISIADSGPGIAEQYKDDIFKPFFTTKSSGEGTGLGLAICKEIIEKRDGTISARNLAQGGCVFEVLIPF